MQAFALNDLALCTRQVELYVNKKLRISNAKMINNGGTLEFTGRVQKSTGFLVRAGRDRDRAQPCSHST